MRSATPSAIDRTTADLTEPSRFPLGFDCDSESILVREASMDDESLFE